MIRDLLIALGTFSSAGLFLGIWLAIISESDTPVRSAILWLVPSFVLSLVSVAGCFAIFAPAVRLVGGIFL